MTHAIRIHAAGGPEQMRWEAVDVPRPGPGQVRLRHTAIGLNYIDVYHRSGLYPVPLPAVLGSEGAGIVIEVGPDVTEPRVGERVAYAGGPVGAYAQERLYPADRLVHVPDALSDTQAAGAMLQGLTAWYLLRRTYPVQPGDAILVHAAAGGVGLLLCQWAAALGATVIGTVSSEAKARLARANGATHVIDTSREDFVARVVEITRGAKVRVCYDGVGKDTFLRSLDCLAPRGLEVSFGNASGKVPPFDLSLLASKGSLFVTRPVLQSYVAARGELLAGAAELFDVVARGVVRVHVNQTLPLREAAQAHRDLEGRRTTGKTVLLP